MIQAINFDGDQTIMKNTTKEQFKLITLTKIDKLS